MAQDDIYAIFKSKWTENNEPIISLQADHTFLDLLDNCYETSKSGKSRNKTNNFKTKKYFLYPLLFLAVCEIALILYWIASPNSRDSWQYLLTFSSILATTCFLTSYIIAKWIGIRSYQETWARHSLYHTHLVQEMVCFVYNLGEYANKPLLDQKKIFIAAFLVHTENNAQLFANNMTKNEKPLTDFPSFSPIK